MPDVEKICEIQCIANPRRTQGGCPDFLSRAATEPVRHLHQSIPAYNPTPLTVLPSLAQMLGIGAICIKDESKRFGLNAFKGLGGTYALCRVVCEKLGLDYRTVTLEQLQTPENREKIMKEVSFADLMMMKPADLNNKLRTIKGIGDATASIIATEIPLFYQDIDTIRRLPNIQFTYGLSQKIIRWTGCRDAELEEQLMAAGFDASSFLPNVTPSESPPVI